MANLILIRDLCERKKITLREVASRVGRDESSIQSLMRRGSTNTKTVEAIAEALGVSPAVFFGGGTDDEIVELRKEIDHLREIIREKERTIKILLDDRDKTEQPGK